MPVLRGVLSFALVGLCGGQPPSLAPPPVRATLKQIIETLDGYPLSPETSEAVAGIRKSAAWLAGRLRDNTPAPYGRSIERHLDLLRAALDSGPVRQAETLQYVLEDIKLKHADCRQFGMGRLVKLEVRTKKEGEEVKGWQVFYRWIPSRAVGEVRPQPFPALSSPTSVDLPPGAYTIQARKSVEGKELASAEMPVPVGGRKAVTFEVPVP